MSLYGFPREPEPTDVETPEPRMPHQRVASAPVAVPSAPPDDIGRDPLAPSEPALTAPVSWFGQPAEAGADASDEFGPPMTTSFGVDADADSHLNGGRAHGVGTAGLATAGGGTEAVGWQTSEAESSWQPSHVLEPTSGPTPPTPVPGEIPPRTSAPVLDPDFLDEPEIPPWDRKPLMVVIVAAAVLVLISIISGVVSAAMFAPSMPVASWRDPGSQPTETPPASQAPAAPPVLNDTVTLSGVGDVIMGSAPGNLPPNDGAGFFDPVKQALASDLVMGNLETPLTEPTPFSKCGSPPVTGCFQFSVPPSYANHLRDAGFQVLSLANNHTNDMGSQGLTSTRDALTAAGLQHTGGVDQITNVTVKGIKVAVLGFSVYSWGANLNNIAAAANLVRKADEDADLVLIQMQGGAEGADETHVKPGHEVFLGEDRGDLLAFSHAVIDAGADVVFGHGPHVMRGMEFYKGRLIAYSLGNFCGYRVLSTAGFLGVGGVLKVTLKKDGTWVAGTLVATEMVNGGIAVPDPDLRALAFVGGLSREDFGANAAVVSTSDGAITPPA